jgi:ABC-2 type transport system permease protein
MLIMGVPAFGILFPGVISDWIKAVPTHYLVDTMHRVVNLEAGWSGVWTNLMILLAFDVVLVYLGVAALGRKLR